MESLQVPLEPLSYGTLKDSRTFTHGLFRFPGRFHPPLVRHLLGIHPEARLIGDMMVGCGTTAVETVVSGRRGLFSDIDPLSCLLTRAKSHPVEPDELTSAINSVIERASPLAQRGTKQEVAMGLISELEESTSFRAPSDVFFWFQNYVAANFAKILLGVADEKLIGNLRDSVLALIAASIRRMSRADPNTSSGLEITKVRAKSLKEGLRFDVEVELRRRTKTLCKGYHEMLDLKGLGKASVVAHDARDWESLCEAKGEYPDLIITSPCYTTAIEYWRRHKLENSWLGLVEPEEFTSYRRSFLGMGTQKPDPDSLTPYVKTLYDQLVGMGLKSKAKSLARYFNDSALWLGQVSRVLKKSNGTAYVVVGSNTTHGLSLDIPRGLFEISSLVGLKASTVKTYQIKNSYMQYTTNGERIRVETVQKMVPA